MEKEYPHVPAAHINALAEEGTREEHIKWLQQQWNEICWLRAQLRSAPTPPATEGEKDGLVHGDDSGPLLSGAVAQVALTPPLDLASLRERLRRMGVWGGDKAALATLAEADRALERATEIIEYMNKKASDDAGELTAACATIAALRKEMDDLISATTDAAHEEQLAALRDALDAERAKQEKWLEEYPYSERAPAILEALNNVAAALSNTARRGDEPR